MKAKAIGWMVAHLEKLRTYHEWETGNVRALTCIRQALYYLYSL